MIGSAGRWLVAGAAVAALAGAVALQTVRDRWYPRDQTERARMLYVRSPAAVKRLAFGFDALAADVYWVRTIQHYGGERLDRRRQPPGHKYELLYPLLDIATTLDPYFNIAYRFGAIFLSEPFPGGPGRPDQAVALLRKALVAMPQKWQYYHDIGFVYYWHLRDYKSAAAWFLRAAAQPDAPNWLRPLAASMLTRSDDRAAARFMWQQILKSDEAWLRRTAEHSLLQLRALDEIDQLEAAIRRVPLGPGERTWSTLITKGVLLRVPLDPTGTPYDLDPDTGRVSVGSQSPLRPMPEETRRS